MKTRRQNPQAELIWEGRIHLGDEPGIHGDAAYAGLVVDFPVTLTPFDPTGGEPADVSFELKADEVEVMGGYPGHKVTVFAYDPDPNTPQKWLRQEVGQGRMDKDTVLVKTAGVGQERYFSVRLEVEIDFHPGLYDDFVLLSLSLYSTTHYADFGFRYL